MNVLCKHFHKEVEDMCHGTVDNRQVLDSVDLLWKLVKVEGNDYGWLNRLL